ncbi:MAG: hypothetical protein PUC14_06200 [Bacteroidales bacterium]|nr:hypothetical protein [Bacteroidales bacterium]MDD5975294.1 hypothetical protein [Bacteroidales bacterium]MDY5193841.1 hypothetical protein [Candidatus Aphodosoma sp.]
MNSEDIEKTTIKREDKESKINIDELDKIIQSVEFPDDYDAFDDELLDMIP